MSREMHAHFRTLAGYNAWANRRLYDAAGKLPESEYLKSRQAFFKSIHGTLNHILVGDRLWMGRLQGRESGIKSLGHMLYADLAGLRVARQAEDARFIAFVDRLGEAELLGSVNYKDTEGKPRTLPLPQALAHLLNHQTHHRGQAHDQLSQTSVAPPELDLIYYLLENH
jgi:uncharacterized damage-inducible protein DinB